MADARALERAGAFAVVLNATELLSAHSHTAPCPRIVVACCMKNGSTMWPRYCLCTSTANAHTRSNWGHREQNLFEHMPAPYLHRPFVAQMHLRAHQPNLDIVRAMSISVVCLWRNLGDVRLSFDDHIGLEDHRSPVGYIHDPSRYLALPSDHRHYVIEHALPWYIAFYGSWRDSDSQLRLRRSQ